MIGSLDRYLLRRVITAFALMLIGFSGLAVVLDLLANADKAISETGGLGDVWIYAAARLPLIAVKLAPIAGLLAALITLLALARSGELGAAAALGASQGRIIRALLPAAGAIALALFAIGEWATPPAAEQLRAMGLNPFARLAQPTDAVWIRENDDIVRIGRVALDEQSLEDVTIFRRKSDGRLAFEIRATGAIRTEGGWRLEDVTILASDMRAPETGDVMEWPTELAPSSFKILAAHPAELPISAIRVLENSPGASPKPDFFYTLWVHRKYASAISGGVLLLLAAPFASRLARGRSLAVPLVSGLVVGFIYFVFENLATAAAESGAIGPVAGAWGPPIILVLLIVALTAFQERPG